jgi:hypothetical protein
MGTAGKNNHYGATYILKNYNRPIKKKKKKKICYFYCRPIGIGIIIVVGIY